MAAERDARDRGGAGEWLAMAARVGVILAAAAILSVAWIVWASYLNGGSARPPSFGGASDRWPPLPEGAVIAVRGDRCPPPWQTYLPAQGRFILGAGAGGALNLDANGVLAPVRKAGETGGKAGVELAINDLPPHSHRFVVAKAVAGWVGPHPQTVPASPPTSIVVGMPDGDPSSGILAPFAIKRGAGWRDYEVVDSLEAVGGVITSDRRHAAARHDNMPPYVALTFCLYSSILPSVVSPD